MVFNGINVWCWIILYIRTKMKRANSKWMHIHIWTTMYRWLIGIPLDTVLSFILFLSTYFLKDWTNTFYTRTSEAAQTVSTHTIHVQFTLQTRFGKCTFFQSSASLRFHRFHMVSICETVNGMANQPRSKRRRWKQHINGTDSFARELQFLILNEDGRQNVKKSEASQTLDAFWNFDEFFFSSK